MAALKTKLAPTSAALADLLAVLDLQPTGAADEYQGGNVEGGRKRVYGGQVLAQAIVAASRTVVTDRPMHSLHGYFLIGGKPIAPVMYRVERIRDGGSFSTRRVTAHQEASAPLFAMMASFHGVEQGLDHTASMPDTPIPDDVATIETLLGREDIKMPSGMRAYYGRELPLDIRIVDLEKFQDGFAENGAWGGGPAPRQRIWLRAKTKLPDDPAIHRALLAYASDFALVETALLPHGRMILGGGMQLASLDHALWFHRPFRLDDWLLYVLDSPSAAGGRGFARGAFFNTAGEIVASVTQELLMRPLNQPA